jgi:hypothetical protein
MDLFFGEDEFGDGFIKPKYSCNCNYFEIVFGNNIIITFAQQIITYYKIWTKARIIVRT